LKKDEEEQGDVHEPQDNVSDQEWLSWNGAKKFDRLIRMWLRAAEQKGRSKQTEKMSSRECKRQKQKVRSKPDGSSKPSRIETLPPPANSISPEDVVTLQEDLGSPFKTFVQNSTEFM